MAEHAPARLLVMRTVYLGLALIIPLFYMLPMSAQPSSWAPPDILLALSYAWAVRRPEYVPTLALVVAFLTSDFLLQRPPGLWTAICLIALEWAKSRELRGDETTFVLEWLNIVPLTIGVMLAYRAVLFITITNPGPLGTAAVQVAATIAIYPLVVLVSHFIFHVRRTSPGDID